MKQCDPLRREASNLAISKVFFWRRLSKVNRWVFFTVIGIIYAVGFFFIIIQLKTARSTEAAWFDDNWAYRHLVTFTHNANISADRAVTFTLDTAELITAGLMQSDCDDTRFTDPNGNLLKFDLTGTCNNASTTYEVIFPKIVNGSNLFYVYYGNPAALNAEVDSTGYTALTPSGGDPSLTNPTTSGNQEKAPSPTLHWNFDDATGTTAQDSTTNNLDGTLNNTPTWQTEDMCVAGKCLWFDGANNENVSRADNAKLDFAAADNFTIQAWVKRNGASSANNFIMTKAQTGYTGYKLYQDASGDYCFDVSDGTNTDTACTSAVEFDDDKWHLVQGVKSGTTSITLYVDGKQRAQDASIAATGTLANTGTFYVGVDLDGTSNEWLGFIDEVKVYPYARTAAQVLVDYNARGSGKGAGAVLGVKDQKYLSEGLVGYWKMDEADWTNDCTATSVTDSSGNSNNGKSCPSTTGPDPGAGKFGNAGNFDGSDDYVSATVSSGGTAASPTFTMSAWIYLRNGSNGSDLFAGRMGFHHGINGNGSNNNSLSCVVSSTTANFYVSSTQDVLNTWTHMTCVYDSSTSTLTGYMNGSLIGTNTFTGTFYDPGTTFYIGGNTVPQNPYAIIDEARVYNRALTPREVEGLYEFAPRPVGYWKFEEATGTSVNDNSGNANTGTWNGTGSHWDTGRFGKAGKFNGTDDFVDVTSNEMLRPKSITVEAWAKSATSTWNTYGWIVAHRTQTGNNGYLLHPEGGGTRMIYAQVGINGNTNTVTHTPDDITIWHHYAFTYDGTILKFYVDGVLVGSDGTYTGDITYNGAGPDMKIGSDSPACCPGRFGNGQIDEVKIYNYARTQKQIVSDMNAGHPAVGSPVGSAVAHYDFDEGYGTTANNFGNAGSTLNGTMSNFNSPAVSTSGWSNEGKFGKALSFDGADDVVTVTNANAIDFDTNLASGSAFMAWINPGSAGEGSGGQIYNKGTNTWLRVDTLSGSTLDVEASLDLETTDATVNISSAVSTNTWSHVAVVHEDDTDDEICVYINAVQKGCSTNGVGRPTITDTSNLLIGGSTSNNFFGKIDEFKVYNYPLTADEIKRDYNRSSSQVLGTLSTIGATQTASSSASAEYCIPGDSTSCSAPVGRWDFEEKTGTSANDTSGNANTGTLGGDGAGTDLPTWTTGKYGGALSFDGSDDVVNAGSNSVLDNMTTWTYEAWVNPSSIPSGQGIFVIKSTFSAGEKYFGFSGAGTGTLRCMYKDSIGQTDQVLTTDTLSTSTWTHVACTVDSAASTPIKIFINGRQSTSGGFSATPENDATGSLTIGANTEPNYFFPGKIDTVRVYNYVRTPAQVAWDYNRGDPTAHWDFDECQGTTLNDSSGNSLTGSLYLEGTGAGDCTTGGTPWGTGATGKYNASFDFDGSNDVATVSANTKIDFNDNLAAGHTFSAWIYPNSAGEGSGGQVYWKGANTYLRVDTLASGRLDVEASLDLATTDATLNVSSAVATNTWSHVVVTWTDDTDDELTIYVNGVNRGSSTNGSGAPAAESNNLLIGGPATDNFDGQIDDFKIFNYELNAIQVKTLYNQGGAIRFGPSSGNP